MKNKKTLLVILSLALCVLALGCKKNNSNRVCVKGRCVNVEVVSSEEDMMRGLQFRESLKPDAGMLFVFTDTDIHSFWMKDTLIPLDMIWMDYAQRVVHIEKDVPPCNTPSCPSYTPDEDSLYVLEVNSGVSDKMGIKEGDRFDFFLRGR